MGQRTFRQRNQALLTAAEASRQTMPGRHIHLAGSSRMDPAVWETNGTGIATQWGFPGKKLPEDHLSLADKSFALTLYLLPGDTESPLNKPTLRHPGLCARSAVELDAGLTPPRLNPNDICISLDSVPFALLTGSMSSLLLLPHFQRPMDQSHLTAHRGPLLHSQQYLV